MSTDAQLSEKDKDTFRLGFTTLLQVAILNGGKLFNAPHFNWRQEVRHQGSDPVENLDEVDEFCTRFYVNAWTPYRTERDFDPSVLPELSQARKLAIAVLVGDSSEINNALADYMMEIGHDYTQALYEKARKDIREEFQSSNLLQRAAQLSGMAVVTHLVDFLTVPRPYLLPPPETSSDNR